MVQVDIHKTPERSERQTLIRTLTTGLAHSLRNPLNSATLQLAIAERRVRRLPEGTKEPILEPLCAARQEIERLGHLLSDFMKLALARKLEIGPVPLDALLEHTVDSIRDDAADRGIDLKCSIASGACAHAEEDALEQAITNIVRNAIDATPRGGVVEVSSSIADGEWVVVTVDDSGPGVPPLERGRIFEPFITTKASGSGLGLPIAQAVVTQLGGRIDVGTSPQGGARFALHLPRC